MTIDVRDLRFSYGSRTVLDRVSFRAEAGELVSVLGPNGAGKSTMFRCILRLLDRYSGCVLIGGRDVRELSPGETARRIAYIPQSHSPTFNYTVLEMVLMGTTHMVRGLASPKREQIAVAEAALDRLGVLGLRNRGYAELSGGERQMVLVARALAQQAGILIMDEPTSNLDFGNQLKVMREARALAGEGYTVLVSSHNPQQAILFSDRIIALSGGVIVADGPPEEVMDAALLERLYHVRVRLEQTPEGSLVIPVLKEGSAACSPGHRT